MQSNQIFTDLECKKGLIFLDEIIQKLPLWSARAGNVQQFMFWTTISQTLQSTRRFRTQTHFSLKFIYSENATKFLFWTKSVRRHKARDNSGQTFT